MSDYLPVDECVEGGIYKLLARNFSLGVFNPADSNGFIGIRQKFDRRYLFTEYHFDTGGQFGTVRPLELIDQVDLSKIALSESVGRSFCDRCGEFIGQERIEKGRVRRYHLRIPDHPAPIECSDTQIQPFYRRQNDQLFYLLDELSQS